MSYDRIDETRWTIELDRRVEGILDLALGDGAIHISLQKDYRPVLEINIILQ